MTRSTPILILHSLLLPMNIYRLVQIGRPQREPKGSGVMSDLSYAERLRETIERKIRLRGVFTSRAPD